jgi:hypothetical protein
MVAKKRTIVRWFPCICRNICQALIQLGLTLEIGRKGESVTFVAGLQGTRWLRMRDCMLDTLPRAGMMSMGIMTVIGNT